MTNDPAMVLTGFEQTRRNFETTYSKVQRYGWNIAFECAFLMGFALWVLWPWLRRKGVWAYAIHLATAPFLFFLPYYCGYGIWAYTTHYGDGGILYTWFIRCFDWDYFEFHRHAQRLFGVRLPDFQSLSDVLVPLNQYYTLEMGGFTHGGPPPLLTLGIGVIIFALIAILGTQLRRHKRAA